jgi:hypothetical protein
MLLLSKEKDMDTDSTPMTYVKKHSEINDTHLSRKEASRKVRRYLPAG